MDTAPHVEVHVAQRYRASPERVFDAWLEPAVAGRWLFATASRPMSRIEIDARKGGSFRFADRTGAEYTGKYREIARPRRLVFTLSMEDSPRIVTRVIVGIVPLKTGCEVRLVHESVPPEHASHAEGRWTGILYGLGETLNGRVPARTVSAAS